MNDANTARQRPLPVLPPTLLLALALAAGGPTMARGQTPATEPVSEQLVVVERSILLQRAARSKVENLAVAVDGSLAEAVAVYPLAEVDFPTTIVFDLCTTTFSRLAHAVAMITAASEPLRGYGPVSVLSSGPDGQVLLEGSTDAVELEAALTVVLQSTLGGCAETTPRAGLDRMRRALASQASDSSAPSLLILYGFDHQRLGAGDLERARADFAAAGRELAAAGRTTLVLFPEEGDTRLEEAEVRSLLTNPAEEAPRAINLGAVLGTIFRPKQVVANDPRLLELATDPRNDLARELIAPSQGRLFAFSRRFENFASDLADFEVLFYRSRVRPADQTGELMPIEVRGGSGAVIEAARFTTRAAPR